jgi:hypothetical protein
MKIHISEQVKSPVLEAAQAKDQEWACRTQAFGLPAIRILGLVFQGDGRDGDPIA